MKLLRLDFVRVRLDGRSPHGERGLKLILIGWICGWILSLPTRGAWIEIQPLAHIRQGYLCRSPHGERGLKCNKLPDLKTDERRSPHGERGLKCCSRFSVFMSSTRRSPHGERGLKCCMRQQLPTIPLRRSPHGERGLKSCELASTYAAFPSLPTRGAWIEIR